MASSFDRPVLFTEWGLPKLMIANAADEKRQSKDLLTAYQSMKRHAAGGEKPGNSIGGFLFEWTDNWWQDGDPNAHDASKNGWHLEWSGLANFGDGSISPLGRQLRQAYSDLQKIWDRRKIAE